MPKRPLWTDGSAWHDTQEDDVPLKTSFTWHDLQSTALCLPVSLNAVRSWLKPFVGFAPPHEAVEWHCAQSVP